MTPDPALVRELKERLRGIEARIAAACLKAGRSPEEITLVGVSKTHPPEVLAAAVAAGLTHLGENRVQELQAKQTQLSGLPITWHFIGHLQTNKARDMVRAAHLIHGVDSTRLADALSIRAEQAGRVLDVLLQVNISGEASKDGVSLADAPRLATHLHTLPGLRLIGLMGIARPADDPEDVRPEFRSLAELQHTLRTAQRPLPVLSMGMSSDFEVAIEEGATHIRVGTALFGRR